MQHPASRRQVDESGYRRTAAEQPIVAKKFSEFGVLGNFKRISASAARERRETNVKPPGQLRRGGFHACHF